MQKQQQQQLKRNNEAFRIIKYLTICFIIRMIVDKSALIARTDFTVFLHNIQSMGALGVLNLLICYTIEQCLTDDEQFASQNQTYKIEFSQCASINHIPILCTQTIQNLKHFRKQCVVYFAIYIFDRNSHHNSFISI